MVTDDGWTYEGYPARLPIVARDELRLDIYGCGDEARFARVFAATWWKLPRYARREMRAHWRSDRTGRMPCAVPDRLGRVVFAPPRIQLLNGWDRPSTGRIRTGALPDGGHARHPLGVAFAEGFLLRFYAPVVDRLPDHLLEYLIAHELAHVLQYAIGPERMFGCPAAEVTEGMVEEEADAAVGEWGFALSEDLDDWLVEQGDIKRVVVATMEEWLALYERSRYGFEKLAYPETGKVVSA